MKIFRNAIHIGILIATSGIICFSSCKSIQKEKIEKEDIALEQSQDTSLYPGIAYLLPTPTEVLITTFQNKIEFYPEILTPQGVDKNALYTYQQALFLGVYMADLSYNILFNNQQGCLNNIKSIESLTNKLGIGSLFNNQYFNRIEKNIESIDSVNAIFNDFSENSFATLETTGNKELISLIAIGAGIESIYLNYKSVDFTTLTKEFIPNFLGLKVVFENYYKNYLQYNSNIPELKIFNSDLNSIYVLFSKSITLTTKSSATPVKNSHFKIKDKIESKQSDTLFKDLCDSVIIVRNKLIELKYN